MKTYEEILASQAELAHFNPNHDKLGRFAKNMFGRSKSSRTIDKTTKEKYNTDKLKKTLKIGAVALGVSLAAIGGVYLYRTGKFDQLIANGKSAVDKTLTTHGNLSISEATVSSAADATTKSKTLKKLAKPETVKEVLRNTNPHFGEDEYFGNCTLCATAGYLRGQGYDVKAGKVAGGSQHLRDVVERMFKVDFSVNDSRLQQDYATHFSKSPEAASRILIRRFGNDAEGVIGFAKKPQTDPIRQIINDGNPSAEGHAFNFKITNGIVTFFDNQNPSGNRDDAWCRSMIWSQIDPNKSYTAIRLDGLEINPDAILRELE